MKDTDSSLLRLVGLVKRVPREQRTAEVGKIISLNGDLAFNAEFITLLRECGVWPQGCR